MRKSQMIVPLVAVFVLLTLHSWGFTGAIDIPYVRGEPASQQWNTTWGGGDQDSSYGVAVASDGVYMAGWTISFGEAESGDMLLVKYDSDGHQLWNTTWGGVDGDWGIEIAAADNGVYIVGYATSFGAGGRDSFLTKYDSDGNQLWVRTWGGGEHDYGDDVAVAEDGVYITGRTRSFGAGINDTSEDPILVKYDSDGNQLWNLTWEGALTDAGHGVAVAEDGVYVAGRTNSVGAGLEDALLIKYDTDGNQLWNTTWGGPSPDHGRAVVVGSDGVYFTGYTDSFGAGNTNAFLAKYDSTGNQLWNTTWGGGYNPDAIYGAVLSSEGVYVVGKTYSFGAGRYDAFLIEYDSDGHQLWNTTWGGDYDEIGFGVAVSGNDIYVSGETDSFGEGRQGWSDAFLVKYSVPAAENYTLNIAVEGNGTTNPAPGTHAYDVGTNVTVESVPDDGWIFVHWELDGDDAGQGDSINVSMDANHSLTAVFTDQPIQLWNTTWGGSLSERGYDVSVSSDAVYVTGYITSNGPGLWDALLINYNSSGHQLWNTTWGGLSYDVGYDVSVSDDAVYITGYTESYGAGEYDAFLAKYDLDGHQLWNTTWGGPGYDVGNGVAFSGDAVYVTGYTESYGTGEYALFLLKYDSSGHQLWNTTWGGPNQDRGYDMVVAGDAVYVTGYTSSYGAGSYDVLLIKYDSDGNQLWNTTWGGTDSEDGNGVAVSDDAVYVTGITQSYGAGSRDAFLVKYNSSGDQLWNTTWGGASQDYGWGLAVAGDAIFVIGDTGSYGAGSRDAMLIKYGSNGYQLWNTTWGGASYDYGYGVAVSGDAVYVTGDTGSYGAGSQDVMLIKYAVPHANASETRYYLSISHTGSGSTNLSSGTYSYANNSQVPVTATPDSGWSLSHWLFDGSSGGSANPYTVTMDQNHTLVAVFTDQPIQRWNTTWGGTYEDVGYGVAVAGDAVYVTGNTVSYGAGNYDVLLIKFDSSGHQLGNTTWGGASSEVGYGVAVAGDDVYVTGDTRSYGAGYSDVLLIKFDSSGHHLWNTTWGGAIVDVGRGVAVAGDDVYVTGYNNYGTGNTDALLIKYNSSGHQLWNTTWGGPSEDFGYGVAVAGDDVYVTGYTFSYGAGSYDVLLVKYNSSGYQLWNATWGGGNHDQGYGVAVAGDAVYVAGYTESYGAGVRNVLLIKYNSSGHQLWNTTWGGASYDFGSGVAVSGDAVYVAGFTASYGAGERDILLINYNSSGHQRWNTTWGGANHDHGYGVAAAGDGIYVTGRTASYGTGYYDALLVKYGSEHTTEIYELTITVEGNGTTNPAPGTHAYENGTIVTVESFPDDCWMFEHWTLDGTKVGQGVSINVSMDANHSLTAVFTDQPIQRWNATWGDISYEDGSGIAVVGDGIYVTGYTYEYPYWEGGPDGLLIKYDLDGNPLWGKTWGGSDMDIGVGVAVTGDEIYVAGYTKAYGAGGLDAHIKKYDSDGNLLWNTTWGGADADHGHKVDVASDGIYVTGNTRSYGAGGYDAFLVKYDSSGNQLWNTTWGGALDDIGYDLAVASDGIYVVGRTSSYGAGMSDAFLAKYDSNGHQLWNTTWGGANSDTGYGLVASSDGVYITGDTYSFSVGSADAILVKYDSNGHQLWNTTWGGASTDCGNGVAVALDGVYVTGHTDSYGAGDYDAFLIKYGFDGHQLSNTTWGGANIDYGKALAVMSDGVYVAGTTESFGAGAYDLFLVKYSVPAVESFELTITVEGNGTTNPAPGTYAYENGMIVTVESTPDEGWPFNHWELDGVDTGPGLSYNVTMDQNHTLTAVFNETVQIQFNLSLSVQGSGSTDPSSGTYSHNESDQIQVTATPDSGWTLSHWVFDGSDVGSTNPYTVTMDQNHTLTAVFTDQPGQLWNTTWGGFNSEAGRRLAVTSNEVYITGETTSYGAGGSDAYIVRFDTDGNPLWYTTWGGTNNEWGSSLAVTSDGIYIAGYTESYGAGGYDALLVRYNSSGHQLWNATWGGADNDYGYSLAVGSDGIYVAGNTGSYGAGGSDAFLVKYDTDGSQLWNATWGGVYTDYGNIIAVASDGIYVAGATRSYGAGDYDALLIKYDYSGHQLWNTTWGGTSDDAGYDLAVASDGIYVTGTTYSYGAGGSDAYLAKYDADGNQLWNTTWGGADHDLGTGMDVAIDGIYVAGATRSYGAGDYDALLIKYDYSGHQLWNTTWGGSDYDFGYDLAVASDGIYVTGTTYSFGVGYYDVFLVKGVVPYANTSETLYHLSVSHTGSGSTNLTSGTYSYANNSQVQVTATPDSGWELSHWLLDGENMGSMEAISVSMDSDHNLTAVFVETSNTVQIGVIAATDSEVDSVTHLTEKAEDDINSYMQANELDYYFDFDVVSATEQSSVHLERIQEYNSSGVGLIVGGPWSSMAQSSLNYVNENEQLLLSVSSTSSLLSIPDDNLFRLSPDDTNQGEAIAEMLWSYGIKAVIVLQQDEIWADSIYDIIVEEFTARGGLVSEGISFPTDTVNFSSYLTQAESRAEELINTYGADRVAVEIITFNQRPQLINQSEDYPTLYDLKWFGSDGTAQASDILDQTPGQADHLKIFSTKAAPEISAKFHTIHDWYVNLTGLPFGFYTANQYDALWVYALSVVEANSSDAMEVKSVLPSVAGGYFGVSGWCTLNDAGDRDFVNYDIYGFGYVNGTPAHVKYGYYNGTSGEVYWDTDLISPPGPTDEWSVTLTVNASGYTSDVTFGVQDGATDLFDFDAGDAVPSPDPPTGVSAYFYYPDNPLYQEFLDTTRLSTSLIPVEYPAAWTLKAKSIGVSGTATWHWNAPDIANIPSDLYVTLVTPSGPIDLRSTDQCQGMPIDAGTTYTFTIIVTSEVEYTMELRAGWNMVSLPVTPTDASASSILDGVSFYQLVTWSGTGYVTATEFEAGRGYWLLVLADVNVTVSGQPVNSLALSLSPGWSMVGGTFDEVQAADVFPGFYQLVTWTGTGYTPASTFEPGKGYWALVLAETQIQLPPA